MVFCISFNICLPFITNPFITIYKTLLLETYKLAVNGKHLTSSTCDLFISMSLRAQLIISGLWLGSTLRAVLKTSLYSFKTSCLNINCFKVINVRGIFDMLMVLTDKAESKITTDIQKICNIDGDLKYVC